MPRYVALFRGINVGKSKRIAMADLRELLTGMGYSNPRTLLNSGNAVFDARDKTGRGLAEKIRAAVLLALGVDAAVVVKSAVEISRVVSEKPDWPHADDPARLLIAFAADEPTLTNVRQKVTAPDHAGRIHVGKQALYIWCQDGILADETAKTVLKQCGERVTTRNWSTVEKLSQLLQAD